MDTRPPRELTYREVKEIKEDVKWMITNLNPEAYSLWQSKLKEMFCHFNLIRYRLKGNINRYFPNKEVSELKFALDEFLKTVSSYNKSRKFRHLLKLSMDKKAVIVFKTAKKLQKAIS